jgi:XapX domain-containing protein
MTIDEEGPSLGVDLFSYISPAFTYNKSRHIVQEDVMKTVILAIVTGFLVGFIFALFKLPIPAPPALAGIAGIVGIYLGFKAFTSIQPWIESVFK